MWRVIYALNSCLCFGYFAYLHFYGASFGDGFAAGCFLWNAFWFLEHWPKGEKA